MLTFSMQLLSTCPGFDSLYSCTLLTICCWLVLRKIYQPWRHAERSWSSNGFSCYHRTWLFEFHVLP
jgi:hypothetical protein